MRNISEMLFGNEYSLYFFYGFAFVLMGFKLIIRPESKYDLGKRVWLLACFGLIHGATEFLHGWIYLQKNFIFYYDVTWAFMIERILLGTSFMFLFFFGIELILLAKPGMRNLRVIPAVLWLTWIGYFFGWKIYINQAMTHESIYFGIVTSRYFLGFPSAIITAVGLFMQLKHGNYSSIPRLPRYIKGSSVAFAIYGVLTGLIVWPGNFFPANIINKDVLFAVTGIPVEVYRMVCAILIAYFVIKSLRVIDSEVLRRLELAEVNQAVFEERERISRDIHDGVLQSIFSVGLRLGRCKLKSKNNMDEEQLKDVEFAVSKLNDVMSDIRHFISNLATPLSYTDIHSLMAKVTEEFKMCGEYKFNSAITGNPVYLDNEKLVNIYYFIKEGLSNVQKHSYASNVTLDMWFAENKLNIEIKDDGVGIDSEVWENCERRGMGLKNMCERAKKLDGRLEFKTEPGVGTEVLLDIPV